MPPPPPPAGSRDFPGPGPASGPRLHKSACSGAPAEPKFPAPAVPVPGTRDSQPTRSEKGSDGRVGPQVRSAEQ